MSPAFLKFSINVLRGASNRFFDAVVGASNDKYLRIGYLVARERSGYYVSDKAIDTATPPKLALKAQPAGSSVDS